MIEHRLIERMIRVIGIELTRIEGGGKVNPEFVDATVDFVRTYADNCHHGKEEKILFRDLERKPLTSELERILNELIEEHRRGREVVRQLVEAKEQYLRGGSRAVSHSLWRACAGWSTSIQST